MEGKRREENGRRGWMREMVENSKVENLKKRVKAKTIYSKFRGIQYLKRKMKKKTADKGKLLSV